MIDEDNQSANIHHHDALGWSIVFFHQSVTVTVFFKVLWNPTYLRLYILSIFITFYQNFIRASFMWFFLHVMRFYKIFTRFYVLWDSSKALWDSIKVKWESVKRLFNQFSWDLIKKCCMRFDHRFLIFYEILSKHYEILSKYYEILSKYYEILSKYYAMITYIKLYWDSIWNF